MPQPPKTPPPQDFEKAMAELETVVQRMERGEQTLEQALADYERGMALSVQCRRNLDTAQLRVEQLMREHGEERLVPLEEGQVGGAGGAGGADADPAADK